MTCALQKSQKAVVMADGHRAEDGATCSVVKKVPVWWMRLSQDPRGTWGGPSVLMSLRSRGWHLRAHCKQTAALKSLFTLRLTIHGDIFWSFSILVFVLVKHQESCSPGLFLILLVINPCGLVAKVRQPCGHYHVVFYSFFFLLIDSAWFPVDPLGFLCFLSWRPSLWLSEVTVSLTWKALQWAKCIIILSEHN